MYMEATIQETHVTRLSPKKVLKMASTQVITHFWILGPLSVTFCATYALLTGSQSPRIVLLLSAILLPLDCVAYPLIR